MGNLLKTKLIQHAGAGRKIYIGFVLFALLILLCKFIREIILEIKKKDNSSIKDKILKVLKSKSIIQMFVVILPILLEVILYRNFTLAFNKGTYVRIAYTYGFCLLVYIYKILSKKTEKVNKILDFIVKHRYKIGIIAFIIMLLLKINFSSLGVWSIYTSEENKTTIFGHPRDIRSDEWLVTTPFNLSQQYNGFKLVNSNLNIGNNNMNIFHGPVLDFSVVVKIFSWGYILFGNEIGTSWAWCLKLILMLLVFFEFGMMLTKKDKGLSLLAAIWITFSPAIMWWSMWDNPLFAVAIIVLFHAYVSNKDLSIKKKLFIAYSMIVFLCNFVYALYPAWQVPLAYIILAFVVVDFIKYRKNLTKKDYIIMGATLLITVGFLAYFVVTSWDGIQAIMSTKYPGTREITGGDYDWNRLTNYYKNFFTPYTSDYQNPSEIAAFVIPLTAVMIILVYSIIYTIKNKSIKRVLKDKENLYIYALLVVIGIFLLWLSFSWPKVLRKITLLNNCPTIRLDIIFEFACLILTILLANKIFNKKEKIFSNRIALIISVIITIITYWVAKNGQYYETFTTFKCVVLLTIVFFMNYTLLSSNKKGFIYVMVISSLIAGGYVNPINMGIGTINNTRLAKESTAIAKEDPDAIWAGKTQIHAQYLIANGIKVINGINEYPNYEWIDKIDPNHEYEEVWNRYAHFFVLLDDETYFEYKGADMYYLHLNYEDIKKINIKYYLCNQKSDEELMEKFNLEPVYENSDVAQYIYRIN